MWATQRYMGENVNYGRASRGVSQSMVQCRLGPIRTRYMMRRSTATEGSRIGWSVEDGERDGAHTGHTAEDNR